MSADAPAVAESRAVLRQPATNAAERVTSQPVQVVLLAAARPSAVAQRAILAAALSSFTESDWSSLIEDALIHGTASLLCRHLLDTVPQLLPVDIATACKSYIAARERAAVDAMAQLATVIDALAAKGIEALPFKGPVLGLQAYGDPTMREYRDLDLLVRREHVSDALAILGELGYRSEAIIGLRARRIADYYHYNGHDILFARDKLPLEPHWAFSPRTFAAEIDTGPIFDRAIVTETTQGRQFACLSCEDTLLTAAIHGGKEQWSRLVWVADIAALLHAHPALDWAAVFARAKQAGCLRMTLLAAELASELLDARLPDHVRVAILRDRSVARLAERVRARLFTRPVMPSVYSLSMFRWSIREQLADRLRYASRTLLATRVPLLRAFDLPDPLAFLYPAVRLGHDFLALPVWRVLHRLGGRAAGEPDGAIDKRISSDPLATPDFFPMKIDPERNTIVFVQMSRETYRQSAFLDESAVFSGETTLCAEIPKLPRRQAERPTHFILHGAFCGSTLLARYLEQLPHSFVLKEPAVLGQLAALRNSKPSAGEPDSWDDWFQVTLALLARSYSADDAVIVKPTHLCTWMGNLLLDHDPRTKVVFLFAPLHTFLLQVLKAKSRRKWLHEHTQYLSRPMTQVPFLSTIMITDLTDGQRAAAMWLLHSFLCRSLLARPDSHRVLVLNGEDVISRPNQTVLAAAEFLNLANDEADRTAIETLRPSIQHSKDSQLRYDANTRAADLDDAQARYAGEVQAALSWARELSSEWLTESPFSLI